MSFFLVFIPTYIAPAIWPTKIEHPKIYGFLIGWGNHQVFFILINIFFFILYKNKFAFFEQFKTEKENWPWEENKANFLNHLRKMFKTLFVNQFILLPIFLSLVALMNSEFNLRLDYESLPNVKEVIIQYLFVFTVNDFAFYLTHSFLHWGILYSKIHKTHHENKLTFSLAVEYAHPIEYLFGNVIAFNVGQIILGKKMHLLTSCIISAINTFISTENHSGYTLPWLPFYLFSRYCKAFTTLDFHSFHHLKFKGNYGGTINFDKYIGKTLHPQYEEYRKKQKLE